MKNIKKIYLVAICGTAMGAIASMLKDLDYKVYGSDEKVYPPMSDFLKDKGIKILSGFSEKNLKDTPDIAIIGNAVSKDNIEVKAIKKMKIPFYSMPEAINHFFAKDKKKIVITGTHGKTTTSSLMAWILQKAELAPSFIIGGILKNFNSNYKLGKGEYIVLEGDEYNTAFFDKCPKFMHYAPYGAIVTSIEFDHADIFNNIEEIKKIFTSFVCKINKKSKLIAYNDDKNIDEVIKNAKCQIEMYGKKKNPAWCFKNYFVKNSFAHFTLLKNGVLFDKYKTKMSGEYNVLNIISVIALSHFLNIEKKIIKEGIKTFKGIKKRQEVRGVKNGITIIDDFAHHPTAVKNTIKGIKETYKKGKLFAIFEPCTNSSMRNIFQKEYSKSFDEADLICLKEPTKINKIPIKERFSIKKLQDDLINSGKNVHCFLNIEALLSFLKDNLKNGDTALIMSNGGFDNIHNRLLEML